MTRLSYELERYLGRDACSVCGAVGGEHEAGCPEDHVEVHVVDLESADDE
ncbi:hypothetical protein [Haloparvum sedimenti]|nr:hypothetical protein [Haloparvum sedimenti]